MMPCSLRSLLLAVVVLSNCITWTASRHHFTHNVSGHRSRHRRQGAGLFLSASYVVPGGEGSGWGDWGEVSPCSRTCGGGVASQKRICLQFGSDGQPQCTGGDTKYFSCETQDCPAGSEDFRAIQCASYNNESFRGIKYKWEPYTKAPNPCELNCMPHGERFYYRHKSKVADGTRCNDDSFDVCVNGTCQPVGCDMMLGSNAREDKCRQCRGNGVNCHTFNGLLDTQDLRKGYNDMLLIPEGSTSIYMVEVRPSNNYLALRAKNGTYYLNGDYHIDFPRSMVIAGALWYYERSQQGFAAPDKLRCLGPTNEPLYLSLLLQDDNVGIEYEYSLPSELAPRPTKKYNWVHENFTPCTVTCGGGFQTRNVSCRSSEELDIVDNGLCDEGLKPPTNQTCNTQACPAQWVEGPWSQCSKRCGKGGTRSREIRCEKIITSGFPSIVSDKECFDALGPKPELYQECNVNASCPTWFTGPWKPCDKLCGEGKRTRQVVCYQKNGGRIEVLDDEECTVEKPLAEESCTLQLCDGVDWVLTAWTGCDSCLSTIRTRVALCATKDRSVVNSSFCEYHPTPVLQEPCDVVPPCQVQWYATQWSKCSVECGKGVQTRQVFCGRFENESVVIVNDSLCADLPKYNDTKPCEVPKEKCPSKWYAGPWSECTKKCGGGEQYRRVMCLRGNKPANDCAGELVLDSSKICNEGPCNKDEILPLDSKSTPIMDEDYEDCVEEEDYPEVGIDLDTSDFKTTLDDKMLSDGTFSEDGSGMEFPVSTDFESILMFEDTGSGFELTSSTDDELFVEGLTKHIRNTSSTDITETTDVSASATESTITEEDLTDDYNTTDTEYDDNTESTITEDIIVPKTVNTLSSKRLTPSDDAEETVVSLSTDESTITEQTSETESTESSETDETYSTESSWSTQTDETSEFTAETESGVTELATTEVTDLKKKETTVSHKPTIKLDSGETTKTTVPPPTDESTVSSETSETYSTESPGSTQTDETTESGDTELTSETESSVSEPATTEVTDLKKETTVSSKSITLPDSGETKKTTVPPPTDESTATDYTEETLETESTVSSETSETYSTESSLSTQTDETSELGDTKLTTETESDATETTIFGTSESSITTEPSETKTTIDIKTSEFGSSETSVTYETSKSESTESTATSETFITESSTTERLTEREPSITTLMSSTSESESELTEESSEASSTLSSLSKVTIEAEIKSSSTELSTEKSTEVSTEGTESSATTEESTIAGTKTESTLSSETAESASSKAVTTEEATEYVSTVSLLTESVSGSTEPSTEKTTESAAKSTEPSTTIEESTVAATTSETAITSETTESATSKAVTTEEVTESVSTVSLLTESVSGSTEPSTEKTTESTAISTEPSTTIEESTVAATTSETAISSETTEPTVSKSVTTEETTESVSTVSLSTETELSSTEPSTETKVKSTESSSTTEISTTSSVEETSELSTTETASSSSQESTTEFTEFTTSTTEISVEESPVSTLSTSSEETSGTTLTETGSTEETTLASETTSGTTVQESSKKTTVTPTSEVPEASIGTTVRDWKTTILPAKPICRKRKLQCSKSKFGCCPDKKTAAAGPFDEGCAKPKTCKESRFGCCPDEISPAVGPKYEGCPIMPCAETLFGCCSSDNKTAAEGNDQEGCPPKPAACKSSEYGCCLDGETEATGADNLGCPEHSTTQTESDTETEADTESTSQKETTFTETASTVAEGCAGSAFGCCFDNETEASGPDEQGCPCNTTKFGCCPDGVSPANGTQMEDCAASCNTSTFGCCPDGKTPAHGSDHEGCCLLYPFGCCPDNYKPADGPHLEGCGCPYARFGCCPDNVTYARGPNNEGCGCQYSTHGCCPDRHTEASGPGFEGCGCHTYQFGCCPDGVTIVKGPGLQGCLCYQSKYGCCGDGETAASGPDMQGCDCSSSKYGCCPDGTTEAKGNKFFGCTDVPLNRQAACSLSTDRGSCRNYSVHWYYDLEYGGCSRFWYGGCEGNGNRFTTKEECEDVCVQPSPQDTCKLPKVKGACTGYNVRWYYDNEREQCSQFVFGGCLGNANNFDSRELCQAQCEPTRTADQCSLPIDRGTCSGNFGRWGFNAETRRCEQFIWGGCEGNSNRFGSEAACVQRCDPPGAPKPQCTQPQDVGNCTDKEALWSFSQSENRCVPFYYTGCGGNDNRFDNEQSCIDTCPSSYTPDVCTLPAETGDCANYRERWYFDTSKQRCRQFYYGGCGGNSNNFASQSECENRCSDFTATTTVQPPELRTHGTENISPSCLLEKDPGPCTQMSTRWAYDYTIGKCTQFQYGGCGGNINNFPSEENCDYYCKPVQDICQLPMLSGPCEDSLMRWFYDASIDACNQFTYGGCEGNDNRFDTREDCERRCRTGPPPEEPSTSTTSSTAAPNITVVVDSRIKEDIPEACILSSEPEECVRAGMVWYFDSERSECVAHENKEAGKVCRNTGVFTSEEACQRSCGAFKNINVCRYSSDPGPCQNFVPKYYFNQTSGNCHEFAYGGCLGGPNRFSSFDECLQVCRPEMDPCKQGPEPGNCLERFVMWYYDYYRDSCSQFTYTGCGGNDNRFETRNDCEGRCHQRPAVVTTTTTTIEVAQTTTSTTTTTTTAAPTYTVEPIAEECRTPDSLSPCGANITAFYYDSARKVCIESEIGACGYPNTYRSEEECERRCGAFKDINVCEARLDAGPCHNSIPKFYWDYASGRCQPYAYGGCKGGANRFSFIEECEEVCGSTGPAPACLQPVETGSNMCGIPARRWRYSVQDADCIGFVYQGCGGNENNFLNYEECAERCKVSRNNGSNEVLPACSIYISECSRLNCAYGIEQRKDSEGCVRCSCKAPEVDCEPMRHECETLRCPYGVQRLTDENGCERCMCYEDPCLRNNCTVGEQCVAIAYTDPVTQEPHYSAQCRLITPEPPKCDRFDDECSRLQCGELGVQRVRTVEGCERCSCVPLQIDCEPLRRECDQLKCTYSMERTTGPDGCERCRCTRHPCDNKECPEGDRCVAVPYRDPITQDTRYTAECRTVKKAGYCPVSDELVVAWPCRRDCNDDADCRGVAKCCPRGCNHQCQEPDQPTTATVPLPYTTTHRPDIPEPPRVSHETEPEVSGTEGGKATLRCLFHGNPPPKITWSRNEITIDADEGRYRLLSDGALEIVSLYRNDSGVYICIANNGLGTARQEVHLQVKDPVTSAMSIAGEPNAVLTGELGRPLVIRCLVYGYPPPTVYWLRGMNGPMVPFSSSLYEARLPGVLLIRRLTSETVGEYLCQAYNGVGRPATKLFVVRAYQTDEDPIISKYIVPRVRDESETVGLKSIEEATQRITTHTEDITTTTSTTTLTTPEPDIEFEKPVFHVAVRTHISSPQTTLTAGSELSLPCEVDGYPDPEVYWTKDNVRLVARDNLWISGTSISRLTIPRLAVSDSGVYGCHAGNAYSSHYSTVQINVQGLTIPAKCTDNPFFANCHLIVRSKFCQHKYYSVFCCKSCMEAGQLSPEDVDVQGDQAWTKAK